MTPAPVWFVNGAARDTDVATAAELDFAVTDRRPEQGFFIARDTDGLALHRADGPPTHPLRCDLAAAIAKRADRTVRQSPLARACGLHRRGQLAVLDTTAGFGRDAATLAAAGCVVQSLERHPVLFALLADAHATIAAWPGEARPDWFERLARPIHADAKTWLEKTLPDAFDVIYLDPMFASPRRKARPQKALAWLAELTGPDTDAPALLAAARALEARVVIKQHTRATPLAPPHHQVTGKAIRFDVYLPH